MLPLDVLQPRLSSQAPCRGVPRHRAGRESVGFTQGCEPQGTCVWDAHTSTGLQPGTRGTHRTRHTCMHVGVCVCGACSTKGGAPCTPGVQATTAHSWQPVGCHPTPVAVDVLQRRTAWPMPPSERGSSTDDGHLPDKG